MAENDIDNSKDKFVNKSVSLNITEINESEENENGIIRILKINKNAFEKY